MFQCFLFLIFHFALSNGQERIETNLEVIYGSYGVPVKYYYNETSYNDTTDDNSISAPGCPKSIDGIPWIYYGIPKRCFLAGHHGPCPLGQKLMITKGTQFGDCVCECLVDGIQSGEIPLVLKINGTSPRYFHCTSRKTDANPYGQVFDTEQNVCYENAYQGPCKSDEILIFTYPHSVECYKTCKREGIKGNANFVDKAGNCRGIAVKHSAFATVLRGNECGMGEKYSNILKKCVNDIQFVVG